MQLLDETNAEEYLRASCAVGPAERVQIQAMAGGVSNEVLYVQYLDQTHPDFVLKQARAQLRTPQPWFSSVERIWREVEVLRVCQEVLTTAPGTIQTPRILFEDRTCYAFAMTAAPREHAVWKAQLLAGQAEGEIAAQCGTLLALLHGQTWGSADVARRLGDRKLFEELRIDPYYRTVATLDAEAEAWMTELISSLENHPRSLVHADFSPKNLLVYYYPGALAKGEGDLGLMMVDFETGHYGDPAFDLGFFLSHLVLKAVHHAPDHERFLSLTDRFWERYREGMSIAIDAAEWESLVARGIQNFAGCAWARIDGKSKVEYLLESPRRDEVRALSRNLLRDKPRTWREVLDCCQTHLAS